MRRFSKMVLWGGLAVVLSVGVAPAQLLNEILRGSSLDAPEDFFDCRRGKLPCDLSYRIYSSVKPSEVNGPANPVDGIPRYWGADDKQWYTTDAVITANFPDSAAAGPGHEWYIAWDGQTASGTADHLGWYGASSQVVKFSEIGNSTSFNCLPVVAQEACFAALGGMSPGEHGTTDQNGNPVANFGGISPVPVPQLVENGLSTITYDWTEATNWTSRDGASNPVVSYNVVLAGNPESPPSDGAYNTTVATVPYGTTTVTLDRSTLNSIMGIGGDTVYGAAIQLGFAGGLKSNASGNSVLSGTCVLGTTEPGDAPFPTDAEQVCWDTRVDEFGKEFLVVALNMADAQVAKNLIRYEFFFNANEIEARAFPLTASRSKSGDDVLFRFNTDFDAGDVAGGSSFDNSNGVVQLILDLDKLRAAFGSSVHLTGEIRLPGGNFDAWDAGVVPLN